MNADGDMDVLSARSEERLGPAAALLEVQEGSARLVVGADFTPTPAREARFAALQALLRQGLDVSPGACLVALDDTAECPTSGLAVVARHPEQIAFPDPLFTPTPQADETPWQARSACAWWRGELAGPSRGLEALMADPAIRLALAGRFNRWIDAKVTQVASTHDAHEPGLSECLDGLEVLASAENLSHPAPRFALSVGAADETSLRYALARGCMVTVGRVGRVWFENELREGATMLTAPEIPKLGAALTAWDANGAGESVWRGGLALVAQLTPDRARAAFRDAVAVACA